MVGYFGKHIFGGIWGSYVQPKTILSYCKGIVFGWIYELKCEEKRLYYCWDEFYFCFDKYKGKGIKYFFLTTPERILHVRHLFLASPWWYKPTLLEFLASGGVKKTMFAA